MVFRVANPLSLTFTGNLPGYYGSFYSVLEQSDGANAIIPMYAENTFDANGVSMELNGGGKKSLITFAHAGTYNIQFSTIFHDTGGGGSGKEVDVWFRYNGTNIDNSNTKLSIASAAPYVVASWNFIHTVANGDDVEIVWQTNNANIKASYIAATGNIPATPSVIITAQQVA